MNTLSFSQISKYLTCARSYKYYYKDRLREGTATAFLAFGSAMDTALNAMLLDYKQNKSVSVDYKKSFDDAWQTIEINKVKYDLKTCLKVGYAKSDFIAELFTPESFLEYQLDTLLYCPVTAKGASIVNLPKLTQDKIEDLKHYHKEVEEKKSNRAIIPFSDEEHMLLNMMNWHSMRRKAHLMLDAYKANILPQIEEVAEVQKKVELTSNCGTKLLGYVDAVVKFKGNDFYSVLDNKTSASPYDDSKVKFSQQLAMYCYQLDLKHAAFGVMLKNISLNKNKICSVCGHDGSGARHKTCNNEDSGKRCGGDWIETVKPEAQTQLISGNINSFQQNLVMENAAEVLEAINAGIYPRNLNTCQNIYGNPCPYLRKCWMGKEDGLEVVE
jgi:hypothetical protein